MASSVEEPNWEATLQDEFIWEYQSNPDPWNVTQTVEWTPYSDAISSCIEKADTDRLEEIMIDENYHIDLKNYIQQHNHDPHRQRRVRRRPRHVPTIISNIDETEDESLRRERLSSPLGLAARCSVTTDTTHYGSSFIHDWLAIFTEGNMTVTFGTIFPVLLEGLVKEGQPFEQNKVSKIKVALHKVEEETRGKSSKKRLSQLEVCCATLYTQDNYLYRVVNDALRMNDRTKLYTLGPFCYLLFNYVGRHFKSNPSFRNRVQRIFRPNEVQSMTLYRGEPASANTLEEYRQAAGDSSKHFKWLPFVSTSRNRAEAERFAKKSKERFGDAVLYIIEIRSYSSKEDRFTDVKDISQFQYEEEILLLPGVEFQVNKVEFDNENKFHLVYIKINSSYISKL